LHGQNTNKFTRQKGNPGGVSQPSNLVSEETRGEAIPVGFNG